MYVAGTLGRRGGRLIAAVCGLALTVAACVGCSAKPPEDDTAGVLSRPVNAAPGAVVAMPGTLAADFATLLPTLGGHAGMAIMAVGGNVVATMGDWKTGPAWSTMKIPLALATLHSDSNTPSYELSAAITESDNSAADQLWQSLGTPDQAAAQIAAILRQGGDTTTQVPANRARSDYSAFGQATWALTDQVRFASRLPCLPNAGTVTDLMGKVVSSQQWGLGHVDNASYKGGWGPDQAGNYLVRQLGLVQTPNGQMAVAVAAQANSGGLDDGEAMLTKIAPLIVKHLGDLPAGKCQTGH
ncbi:hypothetical protein [Nocardia albiluteola]|uniref:hypothetical protein n=1 Tax=Nocardia albiluteola TaxID=2842303 RepID=UPI0027E08311|nr:hypothetical protein [Nocardia albiluteola]